MFALGFFGRTAMPTGTLSGHTPSLFAPMRTSDSTTAPALIDVMRRITGAWLSST
jgi:hypothetical protein